MHACKTFCFALVVGLGCCCCLGADTRSEARHEVRGFWNHSGTGPYPGDWERTTRELKEAGFTMILPNMLWGGVAHYPSKVLPRSDAYRRYGDQIAQCVEAAHRHGIEVHVWKVNWYLGRLTPKEFAREMREAGRTQVSANGSPKDWLCPSHPENFQLEVQSMLEVARDYPVDGLHFDYVRYPDADHCFCPGCRKRFEADSGRPVADWPKDCHSGDRRDEYNVWRRKQITRLVETVGREARKVRPGIKISAAVFAIYDQCRNTTAQDWLAWAKAGYVDFLCPMDYCDDDKWFRGLVKRQVALIDRRVPVYVGIAGVTATSMFPPKQVLGQIDIARELGADGFVIFNLDPNTAEKLVPAIATETGTMPTTPPH